MEKWARIFRRFVLCFQTGPFSVYLAAGKPVIENIRYDNNGNTGQTVCQRKKWQEEKISLFFTIFYWTLMPFWGPNFWSSFLSNSPDPMGRAVRKNLDDIFIIFLIISKFIQHTPNIESLSGHCHYFTLTIKCILFNWKSDILKLKKKEI